MCASIFYTLLAGLFTFVVVTVAAFAYLPWWQAVPTSAATFVVLVLIGRYLVFRTVRRVRGLVQFALDLRGKVLRGATVDVHSARRAGAGLMPALDLPAGGDAATDRVSYTLELTVFPQDTANTEWNPADLRLVDAAARPPELFAAAAAEFPVTDVTLVDGDGDAPAAGPVTGPRRLRLTAAVPRGVKAVALRYGMAQFGRIELGREPFGRG